MDGFRLIEGCAALRPAMRIMMISGYYLEDDPRYRWKRCAVCEIDGFLAKPFQIDAIAAAVTEEDGGNLPPVRAGARRPHLPCVGGRRPAAPRLRI